MGFLRLFLAQYINIYLDGPPMDGIKMGYPHKIEIIK